jgi:hypothetical protein
MGLVLLLGMAALSGCGWAAHAAVPQPTPTAEQQASRPSDPAGARDAALAYLTEVYGAKAPAAGLSWAEVHAKPEGLGGEGYEYSAAGWAIRVTYPVVAPDAVVYTVVVTGNAGGFQWEGQVDAQGKVTETAAP